MVIQQLWDTQWQLEQARYNNVDARHFFNQLFCWLNLMLHIQEKKVTGRKADVLLAAHYTSELLHRTVKPDEEVRYQMSLLNLTTCDV